VLLLALLSSLYSCFVFDDVGAVGVAVVGIFVGIVIASVGVGGVVVDAGVDDSVDVDVSCVVGVVYVIVGVAVFLW